MILDEIAEKTRARVEEDKKNTPFEDMRNEAERLAAELPKGNRPKLFPFYQALKSPGISFICEVKKASPSKGVIAEEFPYLEIAKEYEESIPEFAYRLKVKAGLTGYAQIYGKYNTKAIWNITSTIVATKTKHPSNRTTTTIAPTQEPGARGTNKLCRIAIPACSFSRRIT